VTGELLWLPTTPGLVVNGHTLEHPQSDAIWGASPRVLYQVHHVPSSNLLASTMKGWLFTGSRPTRHHPLALTSTPSHHEGEEQMVAVP
jgi:hypothetical protein